MVIIIIKRIKRIIIIIMMRMRMRMITIMISRKEKVN